jgi:hypothetical protein
MNDIRKSSVADVESREFVAARGRWFEHDRLELEQIRAHASLRS